MSGGEGPIGAAKGKQSDTEALCQTRPPPQRRGLTDFPASQTRTVASGPLLFLSGGPPQPEDPGLSRWTTDPWFRSTSSNPQALHGSDPIVPGICLQGKGAVRAGPEQRRGCAGRSRAATGLCGQVPSSDGAVRAGPEQRRGCAGSPRAATGLCGQVPSSDGAVRAGPEQRRGCVGRSRAATGRLQGTPKAVGGAVAGGWRRGWGWRWGDGECLWGRGRARALGGGGWVSPPPRRPFQTIPCRDLHIVNPNGSDTHGSTLDGRRDPQHRPSHCRPPDGTLPPRAAQRNKGRAATTGPHEGGAAKPSFGEANPRRWGPLCAKEPSTFGTGALRTLVRAGGLSSRAVLELGESGRGGGGGAIKAE